MRKGIRFFLIILAIIIVAVAAIFGYIYLSKSEQRNAFSIIPKDAVYIIETQNLSKGWQTISDSKMWKHLITTAYFKEINESTAKLDSLIKDNRTLDVLLHNRQMLISMHMTSGISYDFIFTIDLKKTSKISFIKNYLKEIARLFDYELERFRFDGIEVIKLRCLETNESLFLTFIDNLLVCSYTEVLVENAIMQRNHKGWLENTNFQEVASSINNRKPFSFYFNYELLDRYLRLYLNEESEIVGSLAESIDYSAFNFDIEEERLILEGYTNLETNNSSYIKALSKVKPGKMRSHEIVTDKTAIYISIIFENFNKFFENLEDEFAVSNKADFESYAKRIRRIEKRFKIDLEEDFFDWIGNEIAFIKTRPTANARETDVIAIFHTKSIKKAKKGLRYMSKQFQKKLPVKIDIVSYMNYDIHYLNIKGFFKLFFGKLFAGLEKPYFTYIEDFVVFSNSPTILMDFIDDYTKGNTLSHKKEFMDFKDEFDVKSNVSIFIQTPKLYSHLYYYSKNEKRTEIQQNKDVIISFARIGFQFISDGIKFKSRLMAEFDEKTLMNEELEKFEAAAENLFNKEFESLNFIIQPTNEQLSASGSFKLYYDDSTLMAEGKISDGAVNGLIRSFYPGGNIKSSVNYMDGQAEGFAFFYYNTDKNDLKAEVQFRKNQIINVYKEYYESGARKAILNYENGQANGDAEFYYESGVLKMKGSYKNGVKKGKWKHFSETGQLMDKEKWQEGEIRKSTVDR
ncbi:DUF3352 domain-containing protein [Bacteroidota bacterium]